MPIAIASARPASMPPRSDSPTHLTNRSGWSCHGQARDSAKIKEIMRCLLEHLIIPLFEQVHESIEAFWRSSGNDYLTICDSGFRLKLSENQLLPGQ
jgi:hypothetical protein